MSYQQLKLKNEKRYFIVGFLLVFTLLFTSFVSPTSFGYGEEGQTVNYGGNYTIDVNNTIYHQGYTVLALRSFFETYFNGIYCKLTGCSMNGNINMNENNITNVSYVNGVNISTINNGSYINYAWNSTNTSYALATDVNTINGTTIGSLLYWNGSKWVPTDSNDTYYNPTTDRLGIRTNDTTRTFNLNGNIRFVPQTPTAPTVALAGAGAGLLNNGAYRYAVIFVTDEGDTSTHTLYSSTITVVDNSTNGKIQLTNIPIGDKYTTSRKIYRTLGGGNIYLLYRVTTIANNVDTTYLDNVPDGSLTLTDGFYRKPDEANGRIYYGTKKIFEAGTYNTMTGYEAGQVISTGDSNTFFGSSAARVLTTGSSNVGVGYYALGSSIGGGANTAVGSAVLDAETSGSWNTGIGSASLSNSNGGNGNTALGTFAGQMVTIGDQNLFLGYNMSSTTTGSRNIMLGYNLAGGSSPTASYELNIGDLIKGTLTGQRHVNISGDLNVSGNIFSNGTITTIGYANITGNLNQTLGNATINLPYGEMKNWTDGGYIATPTGVGIYNNLSTTIMGLNNGFTFGTRTNANGGNYLQAQMSGVYKVTGKLSVNIGTGGLYGFGIVVNSANPEVTGDCYSRRTGTGDWDTIPIDCFYRLNAGDNLTLVYDDEANPVKTLLIEKVEINAVRIGN